MMMQRHAMAAVALMVSLSAPFTLPAQPRTQTPNPDTPRLVVAVFINNHGPSGVQVADAIRTRITNVTNVKQLYVIPKRDLVTFLVESGYPADSALRVSELKDLAKAIRADEILAGSVTRTGATLRIEPRLMLARDPTIAQPLPVIETDNVNDAARQIERAMQDARKQFGDNRACENHIRSRDFDRAIAAARAGIAKYANATIARLCLATAFQQKDSAADSALRTLDDVRRLDPKNAFALAFSYDIHKARRDQESAVRSLLGLVGLDPGNLELRGRAVAELALLGRPDIAIPIVDTLLQQNPGDTELMKQKWLLLLRAAAAVSDTVNRAQRFAQAIAAGDDLVRLDTALADSSYFERQIAAASRIAGQPQHALDLAVRAVQRYPFNVYFLQLYAQSARGAGQLHQARETMSRALAIDPRLPRGNLFLAQIAVDLEQPDTAVAIAQRAIGAGEDPKLWAAFLLTPAQWAFRKAQENNDLTHYRLALTIAQESEKLAASPHAKFFIGVSSFSLGMEALREAQRPRSCSLARTAQEMMLLTQINMPGAGPVEPATAGKILGYVATYAPTADQMVRQFCPARR